MQDMIVCMIGTLAYLPAIVRLGHGRSNVFTGPAEAFGGEESAGGRLRSLAPYVVPRPIASVWNARLAASR